MIDPPVKFSFYLQFTSRKYPVFIAEFIFPSYSINPAVICRIHDKCNFTTGYALCRLLTREHRAWPAERRSGGFRRGDPGGMASRYQACR